MEGGLGLLQVFGPVVAVVSELLSVSLPLSHSFSLTHTHSHTHSLHDIILDFYDDAVTVVVVVVALD